MTRNSRNTAFGLSAALLAGVAIGAIAISPTFAENSEPDPIVITPPQGAPMSFADLVEQVSPAVVSVNVISEQEVKIPEGMGDFFEFFRNRPGFEDYFNDEEGKDSDKPQTREARSLGSGFFISADGLIVTNNHVVDHATEIEVALEDGRELKAEVVGTDEKTDLAVLKVIEPGEYPYVEFETEAKLRRGDWVVALGNPFGFGGTVTAGIVSSDGRRLTGGGAYTDFLQIDAPINRGNSGGPTFDLYGRVVGVNTAIISPTGGSVGIGFAIPAEQVKAITDQIIKSGKVTRGWLGVSIQNFSEDMAEALGRPGETGALVAQVVQGSPAKKAGFIRNDVILKIDGKPMEDSTQVTRTVGSLLANTTHEFTILRNGEEKVLKVTIDELPDNVEDLPTDEVAVADVSADNSVDTVDVLGMSVRPLKSAERRKLGLEDGKPGIVITSIDSPTPASRLGFAPGQAILEVNFKPVSSGEEFETAVEAARKAGRENILLSVRIDQQTSVVPLSIEEDE